MTPLHLLVLREEDPVLGPVNRLLQTEQLVNRAGHLSWKPTLSHTTQGKERQRKQEQSWNPLKATPRMNTWADYVVSGTGQLIPTKMKGQ